VLAYPGWQAVKGYCCCNTGFKILYSAMSQIASGHSTLSGMGLLRKVISSGHCERIYLISDVRIDWVVVNQQLDDVSMATSSCPMSYCPTTLQTVPLQQVANQTSKNSSCSYRCGQNLLLLFHYNCVSILHRFRDIISYFLKLKRSHDTEHIPFGSNLSRCVHPVWE